MPACRVCGLEVAEDQDSCPSCGAVQEPVVELSVAPDAAQEADLDTKIDEPDQATTGEIDDIPNAATTSVASSQTDGRKPGLKQLAEGELLNDRYKIGRKIGGG